MLNQSDVATMTRRLNNLKRSVECCHHTSFDGAVRLMIVHLYEFGVTISVLNELRVRDVVAFPLVRCGTGDLLGHYITLSKGATEWFPTFHADPWSGYYRRKTGSDFVDRRCDNTVQQSE